MNDAISPQQAADRAALRMEAAIQRHTGWQLEYDFTMVVKDRKRLIDELAQARARVTELEDLVTKLIDNRETIAMECYRRGKRVADLEGERALIEQAIDTLDCPTWSDVVHAINVAQVRAEEPAAAPDRADGGRPADPAQDEQAATGGNDNNEGNRP